MKDPDVAARAVIDTVVDGRKATIDGQYIIASVSSVPFDGPSNEGGEVVFDFPATNHDFPKRGSYEDNMQAVWPEHIYPHVQRIWRGGVAAPATPPEVPCVGAIRSLPDPKPESAAP